MLGSPKTIYLHAQIIGDMHKVRIEVMLHVFISNAANHVGAIAFEPGHSFNQNRLEGLLFDLFGQTTQYSLLYSIQRGKIAKKPIGPHERLRHSLQ